jgi:hypothetical protein
VLFHSKLFACENGSYGNNSSCTYLGPLGSLATNSIDSICCWSAQGAKASTVTVAFTGILTNKKLKAEPM